MEKNTFDNNNVLVNKEEINADNNNTNNNNISQERNLYLPTQVENYLNVIK